MRALGPLLAVFLLAGCLGAPSSTPPAVETGRIDGAVVDGYLNPYPFQNVTLVNLGLVDQTSPLGGFTFRDVPAGTYTLISQKPGTDGDVKVVEVRPGQITRVILQMLPHREELPFVSTLPHTSYSNLATPGSDCTECAWSTFILEKPKEMVLQAKWEAIGTNDLTFSLVTESGKVLGTATGQSPMELSVHDGLPSQEKVLVQVHFPQDFTPQPVQLSFKLDLYYVADRAQQAAKS